MKKTYLIKAFLFGTLFYLTAPVSGQIVKTKEGVNIQKFIKKSSGSNFRSESEGTMSLPQVSRHYWWDGESNDWLLSTNTKTSYDAAGKVLTETNYTASGDTTSRTVYEYDNKEEPILRLSQRWNNETKAWINEEKIDDQSDLHGNQILYVVSRWNSTSNAWAIISGERTLSTNDASGRTMVAIRENYEDNTWLKDYKQEFSYTAEEKLPSISTEYGWENGAWVLQEKYVDIVWLNDTEFEPIAYTRQDWDGTSWVNAQKSATTFSEGGSVFLQEDFINGSWTPATRHTTTVSASGTTFLSEKYVEGAWTPSYREIDLLDSKGNYAGNKRERFIDGAWLIEQSSTFTNSYNSNGDLTETISESLSSGTINKHKTEYSDFIYPNVTNNLSRISDESVKAYPNPARDIISIENNLSESLSFKFYNSQGYEVSFSRDNTQTKDINISELPSGVYYLNFRTASGKAGTKKIVKE